MRPPRSCLVVGAVVSLGVAACAPDEPAREDPTAEDIRAINELRSRYSEAMAEGDVEALAACFDADAVLLPRNSAPVRGRGAIAIWLEQLVAAAPVEGIRFDVQETRIFGDMAFEWGLFTQVLAAAEGEPVELDSKYLVILRKVEQGDWRIARLAVNGTQPPPAEPPGVRGFVSDTG